ncbi:dTMP kinase [Elusimicrobiota bacterium]
MKSPGFFISLEGIDKCGKSTQARLLVKCFRKNRLKVIHTREPGGTKLGQAIRKPLLSKKYPTCDRTELFLYEADRAQHVKEIVEPALKQGRLIISERFYLATYAYQAYARGFNAEWVNKLNMFAAFNIRPDLTIVVDIPVRSCFKRKQADDRIESEPRRFMEKVRQGYHKAASKDRKIILVDGQGNVNKVQARILYALYSSKSFITWVANAKK